MLDDRAAAEELITEYQAELSRADEQAYLLEADLERERELRLRFEQGYLTLATGGADPALPATAAGATANGNLGEVLRRAKTLRPHLVILPEAERSAAEWRYDRVDLVELDLARLDSVAAEWASGALRGDFGDRVPEPGPRLGPRRRARPRSRSTPRTTSARTSAGRSCSARTSGATAVSSCGSTASSTRRSAGSSWATSGAICGTGPRRDRLTVGNTRPVRGGWVRA